MARTVRAFGWMSGPNTRDRFTATKLNFLFLSESIADTCTDGGI
jgi:hypothetical protein